MTRKLLGGASAAVLMAWAAPAPAHADPPPAPYYEAASAADDTARKQVTVECPVGKRVHGVGGRIAGGDGRVALVGIVPNPELTAVTAIGQARPGQSGPWSVVAAAVCITPLDATGPQRRVAIGSTFAAAHCPDNTGLYASGYLIDDPTGASYAEAVIPDATLSSVFVRAGGTTPPRMLAAVAVCAVVPGVLVREAASVPVAASGPTTAEVSAPPWGGTWVFGAGARSSRPGMFIDGLGPTPELRTAKARMSADPVPNKRFVMADEDEMTVYASSVGSWYGYPS